MGVAAPTVTPPLTPPAMSAFRIRSLLRQLPNPSHVGESEYACVHEHIRLLGDQHDGGAQEAALDELIGSCETLADTAAEMARTLRALR